MYKATRDFESPKFGVFKKGKTVPEELGKLILERGGTEVEENKVVETKKNKSKVITEKIDG